MLKNVRLVAGALVVAVAAACGGAGGASVTAPGGGTNNGGGTGGGTNGSGCGTNTICMLFSPGDLYSTTGTGTGSFSPSNLTVASGSSVAFTNSSGVAHDIVFDNAKPVGGDIGVINSGTQNRTFTTTGTYPFHCLIHEGMTGTVTVQ